MGLAETAKLMAELGLNDKLSPGLKRAGANLGRFETGLGRTGKGVGQLGAGLLRVGTIAAGAAAGGIAAAAKVGGEFEAQLNTINTVVQGTPENLKGIGDAIRAIARDTGTTLEDLTAGYYDLVSAGISAADANKVLQASNTLAIGGLSTTAEAVDLLTTAINTYGGDASKAGEYADSFAKAVDRGKVTTADIAASFAQVGPLAATMGIELNEISAAYAQLTAKGVPATEVATQMSSALIALTRKTGDLEKLEKATGKTYATIAGEKGLVVALEQLREDADKAGIPLIKLLGRKEGLLFALQTTGDNLAGYAENLEHMGDSAGHAAAQMSERQQGLSFQVSKLKANLRDAGLEISAGFLPALSRSASKLSEFLASDKNRAFLKGIGEDIGKAIDGIDWKAVGNGARTFVDVLKSALTIAKGIFDVINALPTEIKAAGLSFLALNKLSGGLIGTGVGNIVGGLGQTLARNAGAALPGVVGKAFVQKVWVVNMGAGGMGAGAAAAGGMGLMSKVALAGIAIGLGALVENVRQVENDRNTRQAQEIKAGLDASIAGKTLPELQTAMAGVKQGITDLQSNPLHMLVQGEALTTLQAMEGDLAAQIAKLEGIRGMAERTKDDTVAASEKTTRATAETKRETQRGLSLVKTAAERTRDAALETKREAARGLSLVNSSTRSGSASIVSAIYANRPQTNVKVNVSATTVRHTTEVTNRYGSTGGSRFVNKPIPI